MKNLSPYQQGEAWGEEALDSGLFKSTGKS